MRAALAATLGALLLLAPSAPAADKPPKTTAKSVVVFETTTGDVLYRKDAGEERQIASLTKLMTALLTLESVALGDRFTAADYDPAAVESKINLGKDERMTVRDLLRALLLESANDGAVTLAEGVSGSRSAFVADMNRRAKELGLKHTSYANPIGLDDADNFSSATDQARLAAELLGNRFFRRTVDLPKATLRSGDRKRTIGNRNTLVKRFPFVSGVKTGHTNKAGYNLVGSARRGGVNVITTVLGEPSDSARNTDTVALLRWGLRQFRRVTPVRADEVLGAARVRYREEDEVELVASRNVREVVRRGERPAVSVRADKVLEGPQPRGARAGTATVSLDGKVLARVPIVTAQPVPEVSIFERAWRFVSRPVIAIPALAILVLGSVLLVARRRRVATA